MNEFYTECLVKREKWKEMTALAALALVGAVFFGAAIFVNFHRSNYESVKAEEGSCVYL